jgi:putative hydrolase of HD superfamily
MQKLLRFIQEADRLKTVLRKTKLIHEDRLENSAEHSWHLSLMAIVLASSAREKVNLERVLKMLILHDLVEVDCGDCLVYDVPGREAKQVQEREAADRLYGILPDETGQELRDLWEEFEAQSTPEARFCAALDRAQPVLSNIANDGQSWREYGVSYEQVVARNQFMAGVIPDLWTHIAGELERGRTAGFFGDSTQ